MKAFFLNCALGASPSGTNTGALIKKVEQLFDAKNVHTEIVRPVDYQVKFGVSWN